MYFCHIHSNNTVWCCKECVDQQLVDKERELTVSKQWAEADKIELAKMDDLVTKLTTANAVVEDIEQFHYCEIIQIVKSSDEACTVCATIARHKLQGGS